ncbi:hypothetical protein E0I74_11755 [Rhizobium laguerreae]|nr:hypothetical protein E0I74_11755 [Rhizobium laguerreae]TBY02952.1 hypothetical protein E0I94_29780 [Rhizobium laguerreae]
MQRFDMAATLHFNVRPTAIPTSPVLPKAGLFLVNIYALTARRSGRRCSRKVLRGRGARNGGRLV